MYCGAMSTDRADVSLLIYDLQKAIETLDSKTPSDENGEH